MRHGREPYFVLQGWLVLLSEEKERQRSASESSEEIGRSKNLTVDFVRHSTTQGVNSELPIVSVIKNDALKIISEG
jgi:hypothetical protein